MGTTIEVSSMMVDYELLPSQGRNPFYDPTVPDHEIGRYKITITKNGDRGLPNEMRGVHPSHHEPVGLIVLLRIYQPENRNGKHGVWGNVPAPTIKKFTPLEQDPDRLGDIPSFSHLIDLMSTTGYYTSRPTTPATNCLNKRGEHLPGL